MFKPQVRAYVGGVATPIEGVANPGSVIFEVELEDGRTVQFRVDKDGYVNVRGWGNIAAKVGNRNILELHAFVPHEEPFTCEVCYARLDARLACDCGCKND